MYTYVIFIPPIYFLQQLSLGYPLTLCTLLSINPGKNFFKSHNLSPQGDILLLKGCSLTAQEFNGDCHLYFIQVSTLSQKK